MTKFEEYLMFVGIYLPNFDVAGGERRGILVRARKLESRVLFSCEQQGYAPERLAFEFLEFSFGYSKKPEWLDSPKPADTYKPSDPFHNRTGSNPTSG
jgi:hypothetical protein